MAKILVVDDRPLNRELLRTLLQYQSHDILEARDGLEALAVARKDKPDLIFTDILMPNMDGYELVHQLRADPGLAHTAVIFYTASYKNREVIERTRACQVKHLLFKPCEPEEILTAVSQALAEQTEHLPGERLSSLASTSFRLTALTELCLELSAEREPGALLDKFCHSARELVKARFCVLLVDHEYPACYMASQVGAELSELGDWTFRIPELFRGREIFTMSRAELAAIEASPLRNVLGVSLRSRTDVYGWLCCIDKLDGSEFDDQDQHLLLTLAAQVGQTYENAVMYTQLQEQAEALKQQNQELIETQQALLESQELRRLASESGGIGTWDLNLRTSFLSWDERMLEIYGLQPEDFGNTFEDWRQRVHPDDFAVMMADSYENTGQETFRNEHRALLSNGDVRYVASTGQVIFDDQHQPVRLVGIGIDITERKQAELQLLARDQLLQNLTRQVPGMLYQQVMPTVGQSRMTYVSEGIRRIFGIEPEAVSENASRLLEHVHPEDISSIRTETRLAFQQMTASKTNFRVSLPGEPDRWAYAEAVPELLEDGSSVWYGYIADITEQKRLAQSLSDSEERLRLARDIAGVGIWERDLLTSKTVFDERMYELYELEPGADPDPFLAATAKIHPEDQARSQEVFQEALQTLQPVATIARIQLNNGLVRYIEGRAQVFVNAEGQPCRMIGMMQDITERKQAEAELIARDQLLQNLTRQVPGMLFQQRTDPNGRESLPYVSEGVRRIFGFEPEQVRDNVMLLIERLHPDDREGFFASLVESRQSMSLRKLTYRVCVPGLPEKWVHDESVPEQFEDGSILWHGYIVDITEQRRLAESLRASEDRLRLAKDIAGVGIWELDLISNHIIFDQRMYELYELNPELESALAQAVMDKMPPEDQRNFEQILAEAVQTLRPVVTTASIRLQNGDLRYIEGQAQVFVDAEGVPKTMIGMSRDVTERKLTERALVYNKERMRLAQASIGMGVWEINLGTGKMLLDNQMKLLVGLDQNGDDISPEDSLKWVHPEDKDLIRRVRQQIGKGDYQACQKALNYRVIRPNGEIRWLESYFQVFRHTVGSEPRLIGSTRDVTERFLTAERLKLYQIQLENMVRELRELAIRAEAANQAKGEFLNNISHELRTPLNGVLGMSQLLLQSQLNPEQQGFADIIHKSGKSLLQLIEDVLNFSRLQEHSFVLEPEVFNLSDLLEGVLARIEPARQRKGIAQQLELDPALPSRLIGDSGRLAQILFYLLENAVKFTVKGLIGLRLVCQQQRADGVRVCFEVRDTGIGITPEKLQQIFEPFTQADGSLTRSFGGTGLGLSLANRLVELMGSQIQCQSEPGKGSCFSFAIDLDVPETKLPEPPVPESGTEPESTEPRILLVEDNPINQAVVGAIMQKLGYDVRFADDGEDALRLLRQGRWDLVLMDCQMPVMDGYEATRQIRQGAGPVNTDIPVIAVTAHVSEADRQKCLASGMNDYLPKPFGVSDLAAILEIWLKQTSEVQSGSF